MKTPKELRKLSNGRLFAYTDALAADPDMVAVWHGEEPEHYEPEPRGLEVDGGLKSIIRERDVQILKLEKQVSAMSDENLRLSAIISSWEEGEPEEDPEEEKTVPADDNNSLARMSVLIEKAAEMLRNGDANDFTGLGLPRVERLEALAGIPDVTSQERTAAFEAAKDLS